MQRPWSITVKSDSAIIYPTPYSADESYYYRHQEDKATRKYSAPLQHKQKAISFKSTSRIRNVIDLLLACSIRKKVVRIAPKKSFTYKVGFMTLTLPEKQKHTDREFHRLVFKPFIRVLQDKYNLGEYLWRAEAQDNTNIHYHLTINVFISVTALKNEWNKQLERGGYKFKTENHRLATTQIKATHSIKNLAAYLCGYLTKKDCYTNKGKEFIKLLQHKKGLQCDLPVDWFVLGGNWKKRRLDIKLWECSNNLRGVTLRLDFVTTEQKESVTDLKSIVKWSKNLDYFTVVKYDVKDLLKTVTLGKKYTEFINSVRMVGKQRKIYYLADEIKYTYGNE